MRDGLIACVATPAHLLTVFANVEPRGPRSLVVWCLRRWDGTLLASDVVRLSSVPGVIASVTGGTDA